MPSQPRPSKPVRTAPGRSRAGKGEPLLTQIASFVDLFVWLLVLKGFFLPLFIIPTGSMAQTLFGAHGIQTCPNCGIEYPVNFVRTPERGSWDPSLLQCPNCRWALLNGEKQNVNQRSRPNPYEYQQAKQDRDGVRNRHLPWSAGDRIVVHGWPWEFGGRFGPRRWDVVVFKVPSNGKENYIKRLIGLPGETIEVIDGDIYVTDPESGRAGIARKTPAAQRSLWFRVYDHDYAPKAPSRRGRYHPRWVAQDEAGRWRDVERRIVRFEGVGDGRSEIQFVTEPGSANAPGQIVDVYGYNGRPHNRNTVTDVRLSVEVTIESGDGYVELSTTKGFDEFYARLYADGRVTLERFDRNRRKRDTWGAGNVERPERGARFALSCVDYAVRVTVNDKTVVESTRDVYDMDPDTARELRPRRAPRVRVAAEDVRAAVAHLLIQRDVYYTHVEINGRPGHAVRGNPIKLNDQAYFVMGDNSPQSLDGRFWQRKDVGPHLQEALSDGTYQEGTVPADQLIGRAFFVYWPGFMPLSPWGIRGLPDLGRVRWIH